jgi:hypothetical protein
MNLCKLDNQPVVKIQSGDSLATISPAHGARLLSWSVSDWDVICWPSNADLDRIPKVRGGDIVIFPFIARTYANGRIGSWIDSSGIQRPAPMHGFAKDSPFRILEAGEDFVTLRLDANETTATCFPFSFRLEVTYRVDASGLLTTFCVTNRGQELMPWSAGHHYYFHIPSTERSSWKLSLPCEKWGRQNFADGSISFDAATSSDMILSDPSLIDRFHSMPDLSRTMLSNPAIGKTIIFENPSNHSQDWPCVTTWTEKLDSDFFCIEPWSAFPNAIHNGLGLRTIAPGGTDEISCRIGIQNQPQF